MKTVVPSYRSWLLFVADKDLTHCLITHHKTLLVLVLLDLCVVTVTVHFTLKVLHGVYVALAASLC